MSEKTRNKFPLWATKILCVTAVFVVFGGAYVLINRMHIGSSGTKLPMFIDNMIPFNRHWVWFYYSYYIAIIIPIFFIKNYSQLWRTFGAYSISAIITLAFYALWKTEMVRPEVVGNDLSAILVRVIYEGDEIYNCFPSQHVAYTWTAAFISIRLNRWAAAISFVLAILISLSTLFIKQHWFVDIPGGIAVAIFSYIIVYRIIPIKNAEALEKRG